MGKNTWDIMRSVDFLRTLDFVDQKHIGCTGWSLGTHTALFGAAFDQRITATISNGGVPHWHQHVDAWSRQPWKKGDPVSNNKELLRRFGFMPNSGPSTYIRKFRPYIDDQTRRIPVDFDS